MEGKGEGLSYKELKRREEVCGVRCCRRDEEEMVFFFSVSKKRWRLTIVGKKF